MLIPKKSLKFSLSILMALIILFVAPVKSQSYGWKIEDFHSDFVLSGSHGSMAVKEQITAVFNKPKHGIIRELPTTYEQGLFSPDVNLDTNVISVTDRKGEPHPFVQSESLGNIILKIGDPNRTTTGQSSYQISYSLENAVRFYENHDELFWDINGTNWDVKMESVSATFKFDDHIREVVTDFKCVTGIFGLSGNDCRIEYVSDLDLYRVSSTREFSAYENVSVVFAFEKGLFVEPSWSEKYSSVIARHAGVLLVPVPVFLVMFGIWRRKGKDIKSPGVVVAQFEPPNNLTPAEVGTLNDYTVHNQDTTSTIVDLAIRGYLKIIDTTKRDNAKKRKYSLQLVNADLEELREHERIIAKGLFPNLKQNSKVEVKSLKETYYKTIDKAKTNLYQEMTEHGYFVANPHKQKTGYLALGGIIAGLGLFSAFVTEGRYLGWSLGFLLGGSIVMFFGLLMPKRSHKGVKAMSHIRGLKRYMEVAEKDRLKMMQGPNSRYIGDVLAPEFSVDLYEKLLPFALVLGVEKEWSKNFKDIYTQPPDWYQGNWSAFNTALFASRLNNGFSSMNSSLASRPSSSGSSGFSSGGGFSGGGFGGGGSSW